MYAELVTRRYDERYVARFKKILDSGKTFDDIKERIYFCHRNNIHEFPWTMIKEPASQDIAKVNLLKQNTIYFHKNLLVRNKIGLVIHNVDSGTLTNEKTEFFLEPRASYTIDELVNYIYEKTELDQEQYKYRRAVGLLNSMINTYGIDTVLFMTEAAIRDHEYGNTQIKLTQFIDYLPQANGYLEEITQNRKPGEEYVIRNREMLFNRDWI